MATTKPTKPEPAGVLADPGLVHSSLRSLAGRTHRATRGGRAEPHELRSLSRQICQFRRLVRDHLGEDVRRWLESLQLRVDSRLSPAPVEAEEPCGSPYPISRTLV